MWLIVICLRYFFFSSHTRRSQRNPINMEIHSWTTKSDVGKRYSVKSCLPLTYDCHKGTRHILKLIWTQQIMFFLCDISKGNNDRLRFEFSAILLPKCTLLRKFHTWRWGFHRCFCEMSNSSETLKKWKKKMWQLEYVSLTSWSSCTFTNMMRQRIRAWEFKLQNKTKIIVSFQSCTWLRNLAPGERFGEKALECRNRNSI